MITEPTSDPRIATARAHWGHRFVANGMPLADLEEAIAGIERWDQWCESFSRRGADHERLAESALDQGASRTAAECYTRAAVCYHFAKFLFVQSPEEMRSAHADAVRCRALALPHLSPPGRRVEIPFDGAALPGILRVPDGVDRPPVVIMVMGLDSAKEEMDAYESAFLSRGLATLAFDGPGQGEAEYDLPIRGDYEAPVGAVIDWLRAECAEVDAARVGIWGVSLGGYYAPRAAAFDNRITACVSLAGPYDFGAAWATLPDLTRAAFQARSHAPDEERARAHAATLSLVGAAEQIICPLLVVFGERDRLFPVAGARRLVTEAAGPKELWLIPEANHVASNRWYAFRSQSADWLAARLTGP